MGELITLADVRGYERPVGITTGQAMQEALDRAVALWRFADEQLDLVAATSANSDGPFEGFFEELPGAGGSVRVVPNRWWTLAREARTDVEKLAGMMTQLGIAERSVRVEEARTVLVVSAIKEAAMEAGLDNDMIKVLGQKLREKLADASSESPLRHDSRASVGMTRSQNPVTAREAAG